MRNTGGRLKPTRQRLLVTIPGPGLTTAATLLGSLSLDLLETSRQLAAYVGLCPTSAAPAHRSAATAGSARSGSRTYAKRCTCRPSSLRAQIAKEARIFDLGQWLVHQYREGSLAVLRDAWQQDAYGFEH